MFTFRPPIAMLLAGVTLPLAACDQQGDNDTGQVRILDGRAPDRVPSPSSARGAVAGVPRNAPAYDPSRAAFAPGPLRPKSSKP